MRLYIWLAVILLLGALTYSCLFVVDETEFVIVKRFGDPVRTCIEPGLGVKFPWPIDTLAAFDNRLMVLENPKADEPAKEYLTEDEQAGIGKNVMVTTYTCWRIRPQARSVLTFLETMGNRENAEARLGDVVVSELGAALGSNDFSVLISTDPTLRAWAEFTDSIRDRCRSRVEGEYGIEIVDVKIQRLNFPEQNRRAVFDRMRAERETIASRYRSEGEERAMQIRAIANKEAETIRAEAGAQAEMIRGRADAESARIYAEAYSQDPEFYEFLRTLEAYETTFDDKTVMLLSADSEFLQLLNRAARTDREKSPEQTNERERPTTQPGRSN